MNLVFMLRPVNPVETFRAELAALPKGDLAKIAEKTGIDASRLSGYRSGRKVDVRISTFAAIAIAMNRSADELLGLPAGVTATVSDWRAAVVLAQKLRKELDARQKLLEKLHAELGRALARE